MYFHSPYNEEEIPCSATRQKRQAADDGVLSSSEVLYQLEVVLSNLSQVIESFNSSSANLSGISLNNTSPNQTFIDEFLSQSLAHRK